MRRVVITGMGVVSSIGADVEAVKTSLYEGRSGTGHDASFAEHGFKCQVSARPDLNYEEILDRRTRRFMGEGAAWNYIAMKEALASSWNEGQCQPSSSLETSCEQRSHRIDHVFVDTKARLRNAFITWPGNSWTSTKGTSDHPGVWVELELE